MRLSVGRSQRRTPMHRSGYRQAVATALHRPQALSFFMTVARRVSTVRWLMPRRRDQLIGLSRDDEIHRLASRLVRDAKRTVVSARRADRSAGILRLPKSARAASRVSRLTGFSTNSPSAISQPARRAPSTGRMCRSKPAQALLDSTPISSPMRWVAFRPVPVRTTTVVSSSRITPRPRRPLSAAAALAEVGST